MKARLPKLLVRWRTVFPLLIAALGLMVFVPQAQAQDDPAGEIFISPADAKVRELETLTVRVVATANVPISGISVSLIYPALRLNTSSINPGRTWSTAKRPPAVGADGTPLPDGRPYADVIADAKRDGAPSMELHFEGEPLPAGEYDVFFIGLKASEVGDVGIRVWQTSTLYGPDGKPIPTKLTGAMVTIAEQDLGPTPEPEVEPGATPTPTPVINQGTLAIDPAESARNLGDSFQVRITHDSSSPLAAFQASLKFNPSVLRVESLQTGSAWQAARAQFIAGAGGKPLAQVVADANATGLVDSLALFLLTGQVAPGKSDAFVINFKAVGPGTTELELTGPLLGAATGGNVAVTVVDGKVTVTGDALATAAPPASATTPGPASATAGAATPVTLPTAVTVQGLTVSISPTLRTAAPGEPIRLALRRDSAVESGPLSLQVSVDNNSLSVTSVNGVNGASVTGVNGQATGDAVSEGNATGLFQFVFDIPAAATGEFASVELRGDATGTSFVALLQGDAMGAEGLPLAVTLGIPAQVDIVDPAVVAAAGAGGGGSVSWLSLLVLMAGVVTFLAGTVVAVHARRQLMFHRRAKTAGTPYTADRGWVPLPRWWPRALALGLGLVPVVMLAYLLIGLWWRSQEALNLIGPKELFSTQFSGVFSGASHGIFGMVPAIWGTFLIVAVSVGIAFPVSLAFAILATEMTSGRTSSAVRGIMGLLAGIPPVIYALMAVVFVELVMIPKFSGGFTFSTFDAAAVGSSPETWPPGNVPWNAGAMPWSLRNNSTLLGGAMLSMLLIPFLMPLLDDALRGVPGELKQGSLALGGSKWHTFRKVTMRVAAPGLVGATALAALKAMGDVLIVGFVIGWESPGLPAPVVDVLERTVPLTAASAGALGGIRGTCNAEQCAAGYFAAFLVFGTAVVVLVLAGLGQRRLRRRLVA